MAGASTAPRAVDCPTPAPAPPAGLDPAAQPAVDATLQLFDDARVVAIGEYHGWTAQHDFLARLLCDPRFPAIVDAVVVEFGNQRLQAILDRYVSGETVSSAELASVWRESTQRSGVWDHPVYRRFFGLVRTVNAQLAPGDRIRVLAGDPPIDYATVTRFGDCDSEDPACHDYWIQRRDESFAGVVIEDVLKAGGTAVLIAGVGHVTRSIVADTPAPSISDLLEARWPGSSRVVIPHRGFGSTDRRSEDRIRAWPVPSLAKLAGSWVGRLDACLVDDDGGPGAGPCPDGTGPTIADLADAYLYVGAP